MDCKHCFDIYNDKVSPILLVCKYCGELIESQWMPIHTAPRDGSEIILRNDSFAKTGRWSAGIAEKGWTWGIGLEFSRPKYWMPIPDFP
jgi:hypothetical protein